MLDFSGSAAWSSLTSGPLPWLIGGVVALLVLAWWLMHGLRSSEPAPRPGTTRTLDAVDTVIGWPPQATRLLTHRQRRGCELLRQAVPEYQVFAHVPVARFIRVPTRASYVEWMRRVGGACVDLLVCDRASNIVAVVEVRPAVGSPSEVSRKRQKRVARVLEAAGVPLLEWDESALPAPHEVRRVLIPPAPAPITAAGSIILPTPAETGKRIDPAEPPRSSWFDELAATRPVDLDASPAPRSPAGGATLGEARAR